MVLERGGHILKNKIYKILEPFTNEQFEILFCNSQEIVTFSDFILGPAL
jgi:hypothetical protein